MAAKATEVLEQLGLKKTHRMPRYKNSSGNWHTDDIIYVHINLHLIIKKFHGVLIRFIIRKKNWNTESRI